MSIEQEIDRRLGEVVRLYGISESLPGRLRKIGEETGELAESVAIGEIDAIAEEAADVIIVAWHIIKIVGFNPLSVVLAKLDRKVREAEEGK